MTLNEIQHYAGNVQYELGGDDFVIVKSLGRPLGIIRRGEFRYVDPFWLEVFEAHLALQPKTEPQRERNFRDGIARKLQNNGWNVVVEQYTPQGRIDILAERNGEYHIIETKLSCGSHEAAHALGQLLFYSKFYPHAHLWFASRQRPDKAILSILESFNVAYYTNGAL